MEQRAVTAVSGNTVKIESAFSKNLTTVLICQNDTFQGHKHSMYWKNFGGPFNDQNYGTTVWRETGVNANNPAYLLGGEIIALGAYGNPRVSVETRGKNATIRIWKRIS